MTFPEFLNEIADRTDRNDHTGSLLAIAEYFKYKKYIKIFTLIEDLQEVEGSMHPDLSKYRYYQMNEMLSLVKRDGGKEVYEEVHTRL